MHFVLVVVLVLVLESGALAWNILPLPTAASHFPIAPIRRAICICRALCSAIGYLGHDLNRLSPFSSRATSHPG